MSVVRYPFPFLSGADSSGRANQNNFIRLSDADRVRDEADDLGAGDRPSRATAPLSAAPLEGASPRGDAWTGIEVDQTLGQLMSEFRKHRGLSREQVAEQTHIPAYYVRMIESDSYDAIPDQLYLLPFFERYAIFLGLDAHKVVSRFIRDFEKAESELCEAPAQKTAAVKVLMRWRQLAAAATTTAILIACVAWEIGTTRSADRASNDPSAGISSATDAPQASSTVPADARSADIPLASQVPALASDAAAAPTASNAGAPVVQPLHIQTRQRRGRSRLRHRRHLRHA